MQRRRQEILLLALATPTCVSLRLILMMTALASLNGCCFLWGEDTPLPTVDGPEDSQLTSTLHGWVLWAEGDVRTIEWLELPDFAKGEIHSNADVTHLLGVDGSRRLLYLDRKGERVRLRACPLEQGSAVTIHSFDAGVTTADLDPSCRWLLYDSGGSLEYRELLATGAVSEPRTIPVSGDWNVGEVRWLVPGESVVYGAAGRFQTPVETSVVDLASGSERRIASLVAYLAGVDLERRAVFLRQGRLPRSNETVEVWETTGAAEHEALLLPGFFSSILGVSREGLVVYEGMPTTGTRLESLGWGLTWPRSKWTIKLADPRTGKFQTLVHYFERVDELPAPIAILR